MEIMTYKDTAIGNGFQEIITVTNNDVLFTIIQSVFWNAKVAFGIDTQIFCDNKNEKSGELMFYPEGFNQQSETPADDYIDIYKQNDSDPKMLIKLTETAVNFIKENS